MATPPSSGDLVYMAKIAEQAERYEEMVGFIDKLVDLVDDELTVEERDLLSLAYMKVVVPRRASWRTVACIHHREQRLHDNDHRVSAIRSYKSQMESELSSICNGTLELLESKLIPSASSADDQVFYLKMRADYLRYLAEFLSGVELDETAARALSAYKSAQGIARAELPPANPIRLAVALNFSVFYYEILKLDASACSLAKQAIDEATGELEMLEEDSYRVSTLTMELLRENFTAWTSFIPGDGVAETVTRVNDED